MNFKSYFDIRKKTKKNSSTDNTEVISGISVLYLEQTYPQTVSSLPLHHHVELPLSISSVFLQGTVQKVTLAPGQEEAAGQAQEVVQRGGADSGWL